MLGKTSCILVATAVHAGAVVGLSVIVGAWALAPDRVELNVSIGSATPLLIVRPEPDDVVTFEPPVEPRPPVDRSHADEEAFLPERIAAPDLTNPKRAAPDLTRPPARPFERVPKPESDASGAERAEVAAVEVYTPPPEYPRLARRRGFEGAVVVEFDIRADGATAGPRVVESAGHDCLDEAAVAAVAKWRFQACEPASRRVRFVFRLEN